VKDKRTNTVKILIETKNITTFADIFEHIPKTTVADELGIHFNRMTGMMANVNIMKIGDLYLFAGYFDVEPVVIFQLVHNQRGQKPAKRKH
jgi:hypothetical protein